MSQTSFDLQVSTHITFIRSF